MSLSFHFGFLKEKGRGVASPASLASMHTLVARANAGLTFCTLPRLGMKAMILANHPAQLLRLVPGKSTASRGKTPRSFPAT